MSTLDAGTGEDGDLLDVIEKLDELTDVLRVWLGGGTTARAAAFLSVMSPGRVTTETVLPATAWRMAELTTRGACSGVETSSQ